MNIKFSPPDITEMEINEVCEALKSGWITTGPRTKKLESEIATYVGAEKAVCLSSATACMEMALRWYGIGPGDEVIVPAYTYTATASVVTHVGATLVLIDTDGSTFEMDYEKVEEAVTEKTKAIMPVDLGGRMCNYDKLYNIVNKKKPLFKPTNTKQEQLGRIMILSDSAHGLGAIQNGIKSGMKADFTSFSFHAVKNFTTAEGGALTWKNIEGIDNDDIYREFMLASLHGQSKDALAKTAIGAWEYDIIWPAYKCNMTDIHAAIGLKQMERYESLLKKRRAIVKKYNEAFIEAGLKPIDHLDKDNTSSCHLYLLRVPGVNEEKRNALIERLAKKGIATNVHYKPLPMLTAYKNIGFDIDNYPNAYAMYENEITLPLHTLLTNEEIEYVIENVLDEI